LYIVRLSSGDTKPTFTIGYKIVFLFGLCCIHRAAGDKTNIPQIEERLETSSSLSTDVWGTEPGDEEENVVKGKE